MIKNPFWVSPLETLTTFGFRCRIISVKLLVVLVFGVNILPDANTKISIIIKLRNKFY